MSPEKFIWAAGIMFSAASANAALEVRLGGLAYYDTDLDVTWLAQATPACGIYCFDWTTANNYATTLVVAGISGWRLPATLPIDPSCALASATGSSCTGSEMGHLFHYELDGLPGNGNWTLFSNLNGPGSATANNTGYWSGTEAAPGQHWDFSFLSGGQGIATDGYAMGAWAVHSGDVALVPEPGAGALFLAGLGIVGLSLRWPASGR